MSENEELTPEELERQQAEPLPDREVMTVITPHVHQPLPTQDFPKLPPETVPTGD
jgi:hypothetical protein